VVTVERLTGFLEANTAEWRSVRAATLLYAHRDAAIVALVVLLGVALAAALARGILSPGLGRDRVALPAVLDSTRASSWSFTRHGALMLFLAGLPFFIVALADPFTAVTKQDVTFPGRRIAIMIDASSSMMARFPTAHLGAKAPGQTAFFTTVAAADTFIRERMKGKYRDLIALIEFGDAAYVVTPFTNDYDNILLSLSLVGDWTEFMKFPDQGTTLGVAMEQGIELFRAFDFLSASGNVMVIFTDGQDTQVMINGRSVSDILAGATATRIPVYFVRMAFNKSVGGTVPDQIWKPAVEATGGRFYAASDESAILRAVHDIDTLSAGKVQVRQYTTEHPRFMIFALIAAGLWTLATALKLTVPYFQKFP
jgi:Ca-activated chloride channel family protein